jgi:hypothetical protein
MTTTRVIYKQLHEPNEILIESDKKVTFKVDDFEPVKKEYLCTLNNAIALLDQNYAGTKNDEVMQKKKLEIKFFLLSQIEKLNTIQNPNLTLAENICKNNPHLSLEKTHDGFIVSQKPK